MAARPAAASCARRTASGTAITGTLLLLALAVLLVWALRRAGCRSARRRRPARRLFDDAARSRPPAPAPRGPTPPRRPATCAPPSLERFRAIVRELEERAVLAEQPGRTAGEAAAAAAGRLPALAAELAAAARLFDDVRYGGRVATPAAHDGPARASTPPCRRAASRPPPPPAARP